VRCKSLKATDLCFFMVNEYCEDFLKHVNNANPLGDNIIFRTDFGKAVMCKKNSTDGDSTKHCQYENNSCESILTSGDHGFSEKPSKKLGFGICLSGGLKRKAEN